MHCRSKAPACSIPFSFFIKPSRLSMPGLELGMWTKRLNWTSCQSLQFAPSQKSIQQVQTSRVSCVTLVHFTNIHQNSMRDRRLIDLKNQESKIYEKMTKLLNSARFVIFFQIACVCKFRMFDPTTDSEGRSIDRFDDVQRGWTKRIQPDDKRDRKSCSKFDWLVG